MSAAWPAIEYILSVNAILHIKEITLPYIGIILGPPSGYKTVPLELLRNRNRTFYSDSFNPRAMVSHAILPIGMKEGDQHMLLKMKNNLVLAPELAPLFAKPEDELREIISILTRVADGRGFESDTGLGHKGVTGKVMFVMGGAAVEIPPNVYRLLTTFGPKLFFFRLSKTKKTHDQHVEDLKSEQFTVKFQRMADAMDKYLDTFESCPGAELEEDSLVKISLEKYKQNDDNDALNIIVYLGKLLKHLRAVVWTREFTSTTTTTTQDRQKTERIEKEDRDFAFNTNVMEEQDRANRQNYNISLGHALSQGRTCIRIEDIPLTVKVVLSTAPQNRYNVFAELLKNGGTLTVSQITDSLHIHRSTARKAMTELKAVELVDEIKLQDGSDHKHEITLKDEFNWFLGPEFEAVQEDGYKKYHEYLEKLSTSSTEDVAATAPTASALDSIAERGEEE